MKQEALEDKAKEYAEPVKETYGWYNSTSFDEPSGWILEGGEEAYYKALDEWSAYKAGRTAERAASNLTIETLINIARPIAYLQRKCKKEGSQLNGEFAYRLVNNGHFLRELAENCLKTLGVNIDQELENLSK